MRNAARQLFAAVLGCLLLTGPIAAATTISTPPPSGPLAAPAQSATPPAGPSSTPPASAPSSPPRGKPSRSATPSPAPTSTVSVPPAPVAPPPAVNDQARGAGSERPIGPAPVYSGLTHGNVVMASNSAVGCPSGTFCNESYSNGSAVAWVKTDPGAPGNTASSARLTMPAGAEVLSARLYWQLNPTSSSGTANSGDPVTANRVSLKAPGATGYQTLTADTYDWFDALGRGRPVITAHASVKDVTDIVKSAGSGDYTVATVQSCQGLSTNSASNLGCWGGWSLVVAYEHDSEPLRYLQVWDGFQKVSGNSAVTINLSGVQTVASRTPTATLGITAGDGDANITGDYLEFGRDPSSLQRLRLPAPGGPSTTNAFSSRIDMVNADGTGRNITDRNPNPVNNIGYDARTVDVTGKVPAGTDRLAVRIGTTGDAIYPQVVWLTTDAREPDLHIVKANDPAGNTDDNPPGWVAKGGEVTYTFDVANEHDDGTTNDLDTATDVVLTDTLPAGVGYVAGSNPNCSASGQIVTCRLSNLDPGAKARISFKVKVGDNVADGTKLDNRAKLTFKGRETGRQQERDSNTVRNTVTSPRWELTKTVDKAEAVPGDTLTYTVTASNTGTIMVPGVAITDTLPPGTTYVSATPSQGSASGTGPIAWTLGDLALGATATLTITVTVTESAIGQTLVNRAKPTAGPPPTIPPPNQCPDDPTAACATTMVPTPAYLIRKTVDKTAANPGDKVTYTITISNTGRVIARNLTISDDLTQILDDATYNDDTTATTGTPTYTRPKLTWTGTLNAGQSATITYSVTVNDPVTGDHMLSNVVTSDTPGGNCPPGSTDPDCVTVTPIPGISLEKKADKQSANPGDKVTYTVTVTNTGQTDLKPATFTDDLTQVLDDATYNDDATATVGTPTYGQSKLTWTGDLPIGGTATVTYSVTVNDPVTGDHKLSNVVTSDTPGGNCPPGSTDPKCGTTTPVSGFALEKKVDKSEARPGKKVTYTVTVTNTGQTDLKPATFTDDLTQVLDDATYNNDATATVGTPTYGQSKLTWTGDLTVGQSATITYSVTVNDPVTGDHKLSNVVTSETPGSNCPPGSSDPKCTTTTPVPGVVVEKKADRQTVSAGETVTYTVTVTNAGQTELKGAGFTDDLSQVLDDASFNDDAKASVGSTSYAQPKVSWSGDLAVGQQAVITYSVTVKNPVRGDHKLSNVVTSETPGSNCPPGSKDPKCGTTTPVIEARIVKSSSAQRVKAGDVVSYTITVANTGQTELKGASFTDDLSQVLDDASFNDDATASVGTVSYARPKLSWSGDVPIGGTATVTYSVRVHDPISGDGRLRNAVVSDTPGTSCPPGSTDPKCTTDVPVDPSPRPPTPPSPPNQPPVARTGVSVIDTVLAGLAFLAAGAVLITAARRRARR